MSWVTLKDLLRDHPEQFAPQTWYRGEAFLDRALGKHLDLPNKVLSECTVPPPSRCPTAVELADLYVRFPTLPCWRGFLWCKDADQWGQRIFVGGIGMDRGFKGNGFQIHRFVQPTPDWGTLQW